LVVQDFHRAVVYLLVLATLLIRVNISRKYTFFLLLMYHALYSPSPLTWILNEPCTLPVPGFTCLSDSTNDKRMGETNHHLVGYWRDYWSIP
jgi:hypothetical protein